jgi:nucleotide-binding universal stress UspA family protein
MFTRILIGVDGRSGAHDALALARRLAAPSAQLVAIHVARDARKRSPIDARPSEALLDAELDRAGVDAERRVVCDRFPGRGLREATGRLDADLLVLGSSHRARVGRILAGETALSALHGAHCPVAVAPRAEDGRPAAVGVVGVGFDGSAEARLALDRAAAIARSTGAALRLVAVGEPVEELLAVAPDGRAWRSVEEQRRASSEQMLIAAARRAAPGVTVRSAVVPGFPGSGLERVSEEVDLLVIGSRAHGRALRALVGSTAAGLLHTAHCPLLIVPRGAAGDARPAADVRAA